MGADKTFEEINFNKYIYKGYQIQYYDFERYEAINLNDCDAEVLTAKSVEELKTEIDELKGTVCDYCNGSGLDPKNKTLWYKPCPIC